MAAPPHLTSDVPIRAAVRTLSYGSTSTALMNGPSDATTVSTAVNQPRTNHRRPLWSRDQLSANQGLAMARRSVNQGGDAAGDIGRGIWSVISHHYHTSACTHTGTQGDMQLGS